jgi:hypothetical protein
VNEWAGLDTRPARKRGTIVRNAIFYTVIAGIIGAGFVLALVKIATGESGFLVMMFFALLFGLPFAMRSLDFLRDLGAEPSVAEGEVRRKWSKGNLFFFFMHGYYMAVMDLPPFTGVGRVPTAAELEVEPKTHIYSVVLQDYAALLEGDRVRILRYPHSLTIEQIERYDLTEKRFVPVRDGVSG